MSDFFGQVREGFGTQQNINITLAAMKEAKQDNIQEQFAQQVDTAKDLKFVFTESANPFPRLQQARKPLKAQKGRVAKMGASTEDKAGKLSTAPLNQKARDFEAKNPELKARALAALREAIKGDDDADTILGKVKEFYEDPTLADEALNFLSETTEGTLNQNVQQAKEKLGKEFKREIAAGRNIGALAREASEKGIGTPNSLRDMYRDITGNPRDSNTLFQELSQRYSFKDLKKVIGFLLHSLGADMKAKGPSIPRAFLHRLLTETRSLQAIMGVYRFFRGRMDLIEKMFAKEGLEVPDTLTFEALAKEFMALVRERYPTSDKVKQMPGRLGIDKWILAKIIVLSQLRDAIREVAANQIYRSLQHRDETYMAILEALEDLEDELEELLEQMGEDDEEEEDNSRRGNRQGQDDEDSDE